MARIGINGIAISPNGKGVANYQKNLVQTLSQFDSGHDYFVFLNKGYQFSFPIQKQNWHFIQVPIWNHFFWEQVQLPYYAKKFKLDLIHHTSDRPSVFLKTPTVLFLFEIPHHRYASQAARISERLLMSMFPQNLKQTKFVLASSAHTKKDLIEHFQISPEKIHVNYPGCAHFFRPLLGEQDLLITRKKLGAPEGYILHFATGDGRENTEAVVGGFEQVKSRLPKGIKLILAGGGVSGKYASSDIIHLPFLTGKPLIQVYQGALLYVDPSSYEGFGFQIIEAMACGVPVVASGTTCLPEIVGDGGILLDSNDAHEIGRAMVQVLTDQRLRDELREKGIRRARQFNWMNTARETLTIYEQVLNHGHES